MTKFREHRGSLAESMKTVQEVKDKEELIEYLKKYLSYWDFKDSFNLKVKPYWKDKRINWDTHIVTIEGFGVVGFTDGPL